MITDVYQMESKSETSQCTEVGLLVNPSIMTNSPSGISSVKKDVTSSQDDLFQGAEQSVEMSDEEDSSNKFFCLAEDKIVGSVECEVTIKDETVDVEINCDAANSSEVKNIIPHTGQNSTESYPNVGKFKSDNSSSYFDMPIYERPFLIKSKFVELSKIESSVKIVHEKKSYKCDMCSKSFVSGQNLVDHIRVHTGEKPHRCDICGTSFSQKAGMLKHKKNHSGIKPFKCDICGRAFFEKSKVDEHQSVHTGEKPFNCDVCGKSFARKRQVTSHKLIHSQGRELSCDICGRTYVSKFSFTAHVCSISRIKKHRKKLNTKDQNI